MLPIEIYFPLGTIMLPLISEVPLNELPHIVRAVCSFVAVAALPVMLADEVI